MENALNEDLPFGIYHTNDKVKNLKIRVRVRKITNACFSEKDSLVFGDPNELELVNMMKASFVKAEQTFSWQEKIETNAENESNKANIGRNSKKESLTITLFSYIDSEILSKDWKGKNITVPYSQSTHIEKLISQLKPRTRLLYHDIEAGQKPLYTGMKKLVKEKSNLKDSTFSIGRSMIIMASLNFDDSSSVEEIQLCFLQVDDHGTLYVVPDFTKQKSYIFIDSRSETFEFEIENVSPVLNDSAVEREKYLKKKIAQFRKKLKEDDVGFEFNMIQPELSFISINCEIISAKKFLFSDMFIHYTVILPTGWNSESELEGVTETCKCKVINDDNVFYYGYLFSIDISSNSVDQGNELKGQITLKIIFEVTSVDIWGNFRNVGYGFANIILVPGIEICDVHTWMVEPITLKSKLQYYFIGGMPTLNDLSYVTKPRDAKDALLSKYGLRTITSGSIKFKSLVILQNCKS